MRRYLLILTLICVFALWLLAATTGDLRPIDDGAIENWADEGASECSTVSDCWDKVNDSSGGSCTTTPSDGDTTYITDSSTNQKQLFDIDESSIPNGATITTAVVRICSLKVPPQGTNIRVIFVINGTETTSGNLAQTQSYADYEATLDFADDVKDGTDVYEIGVLLTTNREVRVSAIETDITYTPAAGGAPRRRRIRIP